MDQTELMEPPQFIVAAARCHSPVIPLRERAKSFIYC
jgi:hypothetical protein